MRWADAIIQAAASDGNKEKQSVHLLLLLNLVLKTTNSIQQNEEDRRSSRCSLSLSWLVDDEKEKKET